MRQSLKFWIRFRRDVTIERGMSHAVHREVHPPTGVDHAVSAYFTRPVGDGGDPNLIVVSANRVTVYAVRREGRKDADDGAKDEETLEVVTEFDAQGAIGSIAVLRRRFGAPRNQRDALLVAIREQKLSVVEYDPSTGDVCVSSMHSFESAIGCNPVPSTLRMSREAPLVVADPEGRCAAIVLREDGVAGRVRVLPSVDGGLGLVANDEEGRVRGPAASVVESFSVKTPGVGVWNIREVFFFEG